ncbi:MAG: PQQ-binding-like beta-propeller repeat protein [Candidatus Micrarchaeota archaeon]
MVRAFTVCMLFLLLLVGSVSSSSVKWQSTISYKYPLTSLSTDGERLFVGNNAGFLMAINKSNGKPTWSTSIGESLPTTPFYYLERVYIASSGGIIYAIDSKTGIIIWKYRTQGTFWGSSPYVYNDVVYVGSEDGNIYALNITDGRLKWRFNTSGPIRSTPLLDGGRLYVGSGDSNVYCLDALSGNRIWSYKLGDQIWTSSPAIFADIIYIGAMDGKLYAINSSNGRFLRAFKSDDWITSTPIAWNGVLYFGSNDNKFYSVDAHTLKLRWKYVTDGAIQSPPELVISTIGTSIYFASNDGRIYSIKATNGVHQWNMSIGDWVSSNLIIEKDLIYLTSYDGNIYCISDLSCSMNYPRENSTIDTDSFVLNGTATARENLAAVYVRVAEGDWQRVSGKKEWSHNVSISHLRYGTFEVECKAEDSLGSVESSPYQKTWFMKTEPVPPQEMEVEYPEETDAGQLVTIKVTDLDGNPLKGAILKIGSVERVSDEQGLVQFIADEPGELVIEITREGHIARSIQIEVMQPMDIYLYVLGGVVVLIIVFVALLKLKKMRAGR